MEIQDTKLVRAFHGPNYAQEVEALTLARGVIRLFKAADNMPDETAIHSLGADSYAEEFEELRMAVKHLNGLLPS